MKTSKLLWIPRVLAIVFILFISLFALDSFPGKAPFVKELLGFLIHLIPSYVLIIILMISWKKPVIGGVIFILLSIVFTVFFHTYKLLPHFLIISFPLIMIGALFIIFSKLKPCIKTE